jgi:hypothetical protein
MYLYYTYKARDAGRKGADRLGARLTDFVDASIRQIAPVLLLTLPTCKAVFRDYVDATAGSPGFGERTQIPQRALMRMDGENGCPSAANLSRILAAFTALQRAGSAQFQLSLRR